MLNKIIDFPYSISYLLRKADNPLWCHNNKIIDFCIRFYCRLRNHPCGAIYYNPNGLEPDSRCKHCGDYLDG